jgi:hypothetical protein
VARTLKQGLEAEGQTTMGLLVVQTFSWGGYYLLALLVGLAEALNSIRLSLWRSVQNMGWFPSKNISRCQDTSGSNTEDVSLRCNAF